MTPSPELTALLIDDESLALSSLERLLKKHCPEIKIVGQTQNPKEGLGLMEELQPDILFLDIAMPRMDGFSFLRAIPNLRAKVIFTTAFDEYAVQAFKEEAIDYLLKPIDKDELIQAVKKAEHILKAALSEDKLHRLFDRFQLSNAPNKKIGLPTMEGLYFVRVEDISHCKSDGNYTEICLSNGEKILISRQIQFMEEQLNPTQFIRVHRSYVVNLDFIKKYIRGRGGTIILESGEEIPVSSRRKGDFLDRLGKA